MPALGRYRALLQSVFFLYDSVEDAQAGKNSGGTGFVVGIPSEIPNRAYSYGVTNWHVACQGTQPSPVVRINRTDGGVEIFDFGPDQWSFVHGGPDLAFIHLTLNATDHDVRPVAFRMGDDPPENAAGGPLGEGDDVFMIGRFIDYEGAETNKPALRFGNISIMNAEIEQVTGYRGPAIVLDMHSRTGFSGSPVFAYRTSGSFFGKGMTGPTLDGTEELFLGHTMMLIGIHFGQFPESWELKSEDKPVREGASLIKTGEYVEGLSGMTTVIPISELRRMLFSEEQIELRKRSDEAIKKAISAQGAPISERASPTPSVVAPATDNPSHKEDFTSLLNAGAQSNKPAS